MTVTGPVGGSSSQSVFDQLSDTYVGRPEVTVGRIWHNDGLKVRGKIFAMVVRDRLVVKLPAPRADDLVASGSATRFEPRPGRPMKEWVEVDFVRTARRRDLWRQLMDEAFTYVGALAAADPAPSKRRRVRPVSTPSP